MTQWNSYVGIAQRDHGREMSGADCWGLACLVYAHELGIELPDYAGVHPSDIERRDIDQIMESEAAANRWLGVDQARSFDLLLFRMGPYRCHVGIAIDARRMLHVHSDHSKIIPQSDPAWAKRLIGIYRHEGLQ
ncbi:MAG: C40 family peptidase [Pelagimonas sp.]|uniref:C40 family peptidase n=1 Tax=Pelagimonas sp. TaxID=2073170 RepID=UPI003D6BFA8A